ncbi:hypothetical protein C7410_10883 [Paraburkholderia silvatlantica]|uniref:Uncharacterized protein n=1 Tax=Paraburkholderia silvatlantica TaxID=321895 RepID=A0A2V4UR15_9BURK|nr:hypothetical protein C7410_10883 [Paraburkholderia silvatlantica]
MRTAASDAATRAATGMRAVTAGARPGATIAERNVRRECSVRSQCIVLRMPARHRAAHGNEREQADEKEAIDDWHVERNHG